MLISLDVLKKGVKKTNFKSCGEAWAYFTLFLGLCGAVAGPLTLRFRFIIKKIRRQRWLY
jgi:hypothetical protein